MILYTISMKEEIVKTHIFKKLISSKWGWILKVI